MRKAKFFLIGMTSLMLAFGMAGCASTGRFMPLAQTETVIGTVQISFVTQKVSAFSRDAVNTQCYIKLLEAAGKKHPGNIDIRDIVWTTGQNVGTDNSEVTATGKVINVGGANAGKSEY
jgi:hypothetical protein